MASCHKRRCEEKRLRAPMPLKRKLEPFLAAAAPPPDDRFPGAGRRLGSLEETRGKKPKFWWDTFYDGI